MKPEPDRWFRHYVLFVLISGQTFGYNSLREAGYYWTGLIMSVLFAGAYSIVFPMLWMERRDVDNKVRQVDEATASLKASVRSYMKARGDWT